MQALRFIAESHDRRSEAASRVIDQIPQPETAGRPIGLLLLAAALLLAAGVAVPILAGAAAETILANEIAVAALVVGVAALLK
jgi:hypothetical protein